MNALIALIAVLPLFLIGVYGILARRHFIRIIISVEIAMSAVILTIGTFATVTSSFGEVLGVLVIIIIALEAALGLAIAIEMDRTYKSVDILEIRKL
ncbi:MAG TPA: NADH-quinone oxidoreductase subunit K, partial [Geobacterales bacterium]|nr:NADH-quinone oxidoreductase subunit K [Geobacterales bacterium]